MDEREGRSSRTRREAQKGATRGWGFSLLIISSARGRRRTYAGTRGRRTPQDGARGRRRWGYGRRGYSPADGADLSLLIIGCARVGRCGRAGARGRRAPQDGAGVVRPAAQMRPRGRRGTNAPRGRHPTRRWRRVLQGPSRNAWAALSSVLEKG